MLLLSILSLTTTFFLVKSQVTYNCNISAPCGCSSRPAVVSKLFGGETAVNQTWNWAVSIVFNNTYYCGGVLIAPSWVLTTANCIGITRAFEITVSAGTNVLLGRKQFRLAALVIRHPNFDEASRANNIALIRVTSQFNMSDPSVGLICLPFATNEDFPPVNSSLVTVGWGASAENSPSYLMLRQITLYRVASNASICTNILSDPTTQLCALGMNGEKGICGGDIGGPLMMFSTTQQWMLIGINSYYWSCSNTGYPSVHNRIIRFLSWIQSMNVTGAVTVGMNNIPEQTTSTTTALSSQSTTVTALSSQSTTVTALSSQSTSTIFTTVSNEGLVVCSFRPFFILTSCIVFLIPFRHQFH